MKTSLIHTLKSLRGNTRACVFTEPLWGLSMGLTFPYASVYMLNIGLSDMQIGMVASISMISQTIISILSGIIIDKFGRRLSTAVFDFFAWCAPCIIWAFAVDFWFFAVAALLNGFTRVTMISWECLLIEDAEKDKITQIFSLILVCVNLSALFAPIASLMVSRLTLVPAVRILYINAFVLMLTKILVLYFFSQETKQGIIRRQESRNQSMYVLLRGYKGVIKQMLRSQGLLFAATVSVLVEIVHMINQTFWQVIANQRVGLPDEMLPFYPMIRSLFSIFVFFMILSRIDQNRLKAPLIAGYISTIIGCIILISLPQGGSLSGYLGLGVSTLFDALGLSILLTLRQSMIAIHAEPEERSRIMAMLNTAVLLVSAPFGIIAGRVSEISRALPFVLSMVLLTIGVLNAMFFLGRERNAKVF